MDDHDRAVGGEVDVELELLGRQGERLAEGERAVLGPEEGAAAMAGDVGAGHAAKRSRAKAAWSGGVRPPPSCLGRHAGTPTRTVAAPRRASDGGREARPYSGLRSEANAAPL